jgi:hypothetical protein
VSSGGGCHILCIAADVESIGIEYLWFEDLLCIWEICPIFAKINVHHQRKGYLSVGIESLEWVYSGLLRIVIKKLRQLCISIAIEWVIWHWDWCYC